MRKIRFRGKTLEAHGLLPAGSWVTGGFYEDDGYGGGSTYYILVWNSAGPGGYMERIKVDHETVGQYTGLKDRNGKEIFEGDIVDYETDSPFDPESRRIGEVIYFEQGGLWALAWDQDLSYYIHEVSDMKVVGNAYEVDKLFGEADHAE